MVRVLVTGAARGIGLALCEQLKTRGDEVVAACRAKSEELEALGVRVVEGVDVTSDRSVEELATLLGDETLDLLINNAGILSGESLEDLSFERMRAQFEVNALGPLRVSAALLPRMGKGAKLVLITSRMGSIDDNDSGRMYGYRMSKAALNIAGKSLAQDLRERGVAVGIFHPGLVATGMTGFSGVPVAEAASNLIARIDELSLDSSGEFFHANGERLPW